MTDVSPLFHVKSMVPFSAPVMLAKKADKQDAVPPPEIGPLPPV